MKLFPALVIVLASTAVAAEPIGADELRVVARPAEPTAADVEGKPVPGAESGRTDPRATDSTLRKIGRGFLVVPKLTVEAAFAPIRGGIWAYERYHLGPLARRIFFNDAETVGLYPVAQLESGYGLNAGARFVHRDLFGEREHLKLHAGTGGRFHEILSATLRSGDRFGDDLAFELEGQFERRPKDAFYGIGNTEGVEARFRERVARVSAIADARIAGDLHVRASGAVADFTFERSTVGDPIDELYPMDTMLGWNGIRHAYSELELRWDTRRRASRWEPPSVRAAGWLLAGYAGRVTALDDGADYWRLGADLQGFARVGQGPRVISGRLYVETVSGGLDDVPFTQLPRLGGKMLLRGYPLDRFRDRAATLGSVEYAWDLSRGISASTFVDAGRVFPSLRELETGGLRVGYGVSLEAHTDRTFLIRASVASSIDGGVFFDVAFDPVFDLDPRVERR